VSTSPGTIRTLIVDDDGVVRAGLRMILETQPDIEVVGEAEDGLDAIEQAHGLRPGVVLMDIRMRGMDGIEATRRLTTAETTDRRRDPRRF
jgi:DNA-binding NarL/FixJ family response regulator